MTGPLAQQFAQVREVVPPREEIERRISQAEAVIAEPDEYPREYLTDARREITRCERLLNADAALSVIERHVQDMETALTDLCGAVDAVCDHDALNDSIPRQARSVLELSLQRAKGVLRDAPTATHQETK